MSKLMNVRCDNCGAEYRLSSRGELNCRYCGSKIYLTDEDFKDYLKTRDEMLRKDKFNNDIINTDGDVLGFYRMSNKYNFDFGDRVVTRDITAIYNNSDKDILVGLNTVAFIFKSFDAYSRYLDNLKNIEYPSADIKKLSKYLPQILTDGKLVDGTYTIILNKDENVYSLEMFSDGLKSTTTAWIISRLENLGCLLEFNEYDMTNVCLEDIFINPKTHELYLLGGWNSRITIKSSDRYYLKSIREIAKSIPTTDVAPQGYINFLNNNPAPTAFEDFNRWEHVINDTFGGHKFQKFDYLV